ncbi:MAG TPA: hypothetical protein DCO75_09320 [Fibrobacteres bacterium]|nr:hypothetical protein [Fibrobacterota bacterium]
MLKKNRLQHLTNTIKCRLSIFFCIVLFALSGSIIAYDLTSDKCNFEIAVAHLDTQFGWPRDSTYKIYLPNTLHDNFALFHSYPRYVFSFCGAFRYWIIEQYGQNNTTGLFEQGDWDTLKEYISKGNWALAGSMIDETDVNIPCAEAMCRNFLYGNGYYKEKFGKRSFDIYLPDCFGFSYSLPTIANHFGVRGFSTQKFGLWGGWWTVTNEKSLMRWVGPDGSFIYAAMQPSSYTSSIETDTAAGNALYNLTGMWINYDYYGVGDKGGSPNETDVSATCGLTDGKLNDVYTFPASSDSLFRILDSMERKKNFHLNNLYTYDGELIMKTHGTGCYTSRADLKKLYRDMEIAGLSAEPAAVMANKIAGTAYPQKKIWRAWFKGIEHAFHDDITGTSTREAYTSWDNAPVDLDSQITSFNEVRCASDSAVAAAMNTLVSISGAVSVVVYNPLGLDRRDPVEARLTFNTEARYVKVLDHSGKEIPSQIITGEGTDTPTIVFIAEVPSIGYAVYEAVPDTARTHINTGLSVDSSGSSMSNNYYTVTIDDNGDISQIINNSDDKRELFSNPHRLEIRTDNSTNYPAWEVLQSDVMSSPAYYVDENVKKTVAENGPVRVSVKVTRSKKGSLYTQYYRLYSDSAGRIVHVNNNVYWNTGGYMLKAAFYFSCYNGNATYSVGVGTIDRPNSGTDTRYEVPAQQWATINCGYYGVAVINNYKYGWSKLADNNLCNTLIHSPHLCSGSCYDGDTDMTHEFSYAIYGYKGNWTNGVEQQAQRFNMPLHAFQTSSHLSVTGIGGSFSLVKSSDSSKIMIMAVKKAEKDDDYVVRVREIAGATSNIKLIFGYNVISAESTNGMEDDSGSQTIIPSGTKNNEIGFTINKYQIRTFKVSLGDEYIGNKTGVSKSGTLASQDVEFRISLSVHGRHSLLKIDIPADAVIKKVFITDVMGRAIRTLFSGSAPIPVSVMTGLAWDGATDCGSRASAGVYVVSVITDRAEKKAVLHFVR